MSIKKIFIMISLSILTVNAATSASAKVTATTERKHQFTETANNQSVTVEWVEKINSGIPEYTRKTNSETEISRGKSHTTFWELKNSDKTLSISIEDDTALITTSENGQTTSKSQPLFDIPLTYPPSFYLSKFAKSNKRKITVWVVNKSENELRKMIFTKLKNEEITIKNTTQNALKIEMKPPGFAGVVWKAYYWVHPTTGEFIKYFGKKGPPGTPDFTIIKSK
ncbi:MAG: hypothetical protein ACON35_04650 [Candidatus Marinamargulisbacteria bacterium]